MPDRNPACIHSDAAVVVVSRVAGADLHRPVEVGDCEIAVALEVMSQAAAVVGFHLTRVDPDGRSEVGYGAVLVALLAVGDATIDIGPCGGPTVSTDNVGTRANA